MYIEMNIMELIILGIEIIAVMIIGKLVSLYIAGLVNKDHLKKAEDLVNELKNLEERQAYLQLQTDNTVPKKNKETMDYIR